MRISSETFAILKNFRDLNSNILVTPGNVIKTLTPAKNVMAMATVQEMFPVEFGIWDLTSFLGTTSLFDDPDFEFQDKFVTITNGNKSKVKYFYSDPSLLTVPKKDVVMPESVVSIDITEDQFSELKRSASVLSLPDLSFVRDDENVVATVFDKSGASNNTYSIQIENVEFTEDSEFNFHFKIDNLRFIPGPYTMNIAEKVVCEFVNTKMNLTYWVALEGTSSYTTLSTVETGAA